YKLILEREGFQTVLAKDANTALAVLSEYVPDLIILDVMMPGIDGIELCRMIRTRHTTLTTPILVISAHAGPEYMARAKDAGAD
ncbi:PleD family two-component system response regulator, partial [Salmonella sp. S071_01786]|uniref:response regulator n=1 Tax=Salmonella sp. S071_01786 TaxID=2665571 RepID=UPI0016597C9B